MRELANVSERAVNFCPGNRIAPGDLPEELRLAGAGVPDRAFAKAYPSVKSIETEYSAKIQQIRNNKTAVRLREWVRARMTHAVKAAGLTMPQFNNVMMLIGRVPALRKQVLGH